MNLVVTISGRDALPVRALCFVAGRKRLSPDVVAGAACAEGHYSGEGALPTYKLVDGVVQAVDPTHWVLFYEAIESASLLLSGKGPSLRATRTQWFNESTMLLPGGVFVWLDEFQDWFRRTRPYRVNEGETGPQLELPEEGRVSLTPPIPDGLKGCLLAGFPSAPELPTAPTPEQPLGIDAEPVATPTKEANSGGRPRSNAPEHLEQILVALESYAAETGQHFDRRAMPGPMGDNHCHEGSFHWLCAKVYPSHFMKSKSIFEGYRNGVCTSVGWTRATDFYRDALPHIASILGIKPKVMKSSNRAAKAA